MNKKQAYQLLEMLLRLRNKTHNLGDIANLDSAAILVRSVLEYLPEGEMLHEGKDDNNDFDADTVSIKAA